MTTRSSLFPTQRTHGSRVARRHAWNFLLATKGTKCLLFLNSPFKSRPHCKIVSMEITFFKVCQPMAEFGIRSSSLIVDGKKNSKSILVVMRKSDRKYSCQVQYLLFKVWGYFVGINFYIEPTTYYQWLSNTKTSRYFSIDQVFRVSNFFKESGSDKIWDCWGQWHTHTEVRHMSRKALLWCQVPKYMYNRN